MDSPAGRDETYGNRCAIRTATLKGSYSVSEWIAFIKFDSGVGKQLPVLLFEGRFAATLLLSLNVLDKARQVPLLLKSLPVTRVKMAVLAPIPRASVTIETSAKPGESRKRRSA